MRGSMQNVETACRIVLSRPEEAIKNTLITMASPYPESAKKTVTEGPQPVGLSQVEIASFHHACYLLFTLTDESEQRGE